MSAPSFWNRLIGGRTTDEAPAAAPAPAAAASSAGQDLAAPAKGLRSERREGLFKVVREVMVRAGVRSHAYKFKALALDQQGLGFVLMFDIDPAATDCQPDELLVLEHGLQSLALERMGVTVKSVYWRVQSLDPAAAAAAVAAAQAAAVAAPAAAVATRPRIADLKLDSDDGFSDFSPLSDTQPGRLE
jgi:hypothetical protein